ncbi:MAG: hypothetical protein WCW01_00265 [Gammaproteobacteria bacterium]|jgi:hypothetical protein
MQHSSAVTISKLPADLENDIKHSPVFDSQQTQVFWSLRQHMQLLNQNVTGPVFSAAFKKLPFFGLLKNLHDLPTERDMNSPALDLAAKIYWYSIAHSEEFQQNTAQFKEILQKTQVPYNPANVIALTALLLEFYEISLHPEKLAPLPKSNAHLNIRYTIFGGSPSRTTVNTSPQSPGKQHSTNTLPTEPSLKK